MQYGYRSPSSQTISSWFNQNYPCPEFYLGLSAMAIAKSPSTRVYSGRRDAIMIKDNAHWRIQL